MYLTLCFLLYTGKIFVQRKQHKIFTITYWDFFLLIVLSRYLVPPSSWVLCSLESPELMRICLKKLRGLNKVHLIDAVFVWTEPHSKRIKLKVTIQKEVSYLSVCHLSIHLSIYLSTYLSIHLLSINLSIPICLSTYLAISSISIKGYVCLSVCVRDSRLNGLS